MKIKNIMKKFIAIYILLLLILSCNLTPKLSAKLIPDYDDGVIYDEFDNADDIFLNNCNLVNGYIELVNESQSINYNYNNTANQINSWKLTDTYITPGSGDFIKLISNFINPDKMPGAEFNASEYLKLKKRDNSAIEIESVYGPYMNYVYYPMNLFRFVIKENVNLIDNFTATWWSGAYNAGANVDEISMYIWNYKDLFPRWTFVDNISYTEENINEPNGFLNTRLSNKIVSEYINEEGVFYFIIIGVPSSDPEIQHAYLYTDYAEVTFSLKQGYISDGYVNSSLIKPSDGGDFNGWEKVFWETSRPSNNTYIKLQILDVDGKIIEALDGNSQGFSSSPIDLSSLGKIYSSIKLKAHLHSDDPQYSPELYNWGVLWITKGGFYDSFSHDYRIAKSYAVNIENGEVKISGALDNWPIFGKNPENTRSYFGLDLKSENNKTYWHTEINTDIGGWFKSPIVNNGLVYIPSKDYRIYAFNLTADSKNVNDKNQYYVDVSANKYNVESSVAVINGKVIVATSDLNSSNNKVYALNSSDLSTQIWEFSLENGNSICYSAAPTVSDDKVFITSWSGKFYSNQMFINFYNKLNSILNNSFDLNNKLIVLDLNNGEKLWDVNLPGGGLSTPAVHNGLVFVGCDSIMGSALFAFNENTGEKVWSANVGSIGRASPVLTEGNGDEILIVLSREQNLFSFNGTDKIVALNPETGQILWNKTIGNESLVKRSARLKLFGFQNLIATSQPLATPAAYDGTVYVMSLNGTLFALDVDTGEEIWFFNQFQGSGGILSYFSSSPVVVGNIVYVATQQGKVIAFDNAKNGKIISEFTMDYTGVAQDILFQIYSSPIVTDGLIFISPTEPISRISNEGDYVKFSHLFCLSNYTKNSFGNIYSVPIHVQKGNWWSKFNANYTNTSENKIIFSILDGNGNILQSRLDGKNNDISNSNIFNTGIIQLCAELSILNSSQDPPILKSWTIDWIAEATSPVFKTNTFKPDPSGWINNNTPICTISVSDAKPGLDVSSGRYRITNMTNIKSDWFVAQCSGVNGSKVDETLIADLNKLNLDPNVTNLKNIEFFIKDLSGNVATFQLSENFKLDTIKPESWIDSTFLTHYNEPVYIKADGNDPENSYGNKSGIESIALYYRSKDENEWIKLGSAAFPFEWQFEKDTSGVYEICTVAKDNAGNEEEFSNENLSSFTFDKNKPNKPEFETEESYKSLPSFEIEFEDDYKLKTVEYRLNFHEPDNWIKINDDDINNKSYIGKWSLTQGDWELMEDELTYYMYFKLTDTCGNIYVTSSFDETLNITKDTIPPGLNIILDLSEFTEGSWKEIYKINAEIPDDNDIAGISLQYRYSSDNNDWNEWTQYGEDLTIEDAYIWEFEAKEGTGYYQFRVKIWDSAVNTVYSQEKTANVTLLPTATLSVMIILVIILLLFTVLIIRKMRKKTQ
jgi:outer membrane protein assembly factor BamB